MSTLKVTNIEPQSGTDVHITGSLIVSNIVRAREVVTTISSSQILVSGSTRFGDSTDDTHLFTGSLDVSNGITGSTEFTTIVNKPTLLSSSAQIAADITGSSTTLSSSIAARVTTNETEIDALQADSGSLSTRVTTEEANVDALQADSGSFSTRITTAENELGNTLLSSSAQIAPDVSGSFTSVSSSIAADIASNISSITGLDGTYATDAQLNTATASLSSSLAPSIATNTVDISTLTGVTSSYALESGVVANSNTASYASTGSNTFTGNQIISASVLLTLQQFTGSAGAVATGSLIVSGSPVQLYIFNGSGSGWNKV